MSDDVSEFMQTALGRSLAARVDSRSPQPVVATVDNDDIEIGALTQYSRFGPGFMPATGTVAALPQGVYRLVISDSGGFFEPQKLVTDALLRLPDSKSDEVITEIERFWKLKERFTDQGFVHKRGFLLWGPPGSGKTSTVAFVAKQQVEAGGLVIMGNTQPAFVSGMLAKLREIEPERRLLVLLEDIDTIIGEYGEHQLLALLDGESSIDNVVFLATTNYPENLDGRVVNRPSRFDRVVKIGMPNAAARELYLRSRGIEENVAHWVELTDGFSIAHIKELLVGVLCFGNVLEAEATRLRTMVRSPKSDRTEAPVGFGR